MHSSCSSPACWEHSHWPYCCTPHAAINPFLSWVLLYINRTNRYSWIWSGTDGILLHTEPVLFIADLTVPDVLSSVDHVITPIFFHKICFCFHGNIFLFLASFSFLYVKVHINFERMVDPLLVPQPQLSKAPSPRDGKHTLMHITYILYDSGWKLTIVTQIIGNLTLVCPSVIVDAHMVFWLNLIRIQSPQYVYITLPHPIIFSLISVLHMYLFLFCTICQYSTGTNCGTHAYQLMYNSESDSS